eukprot:jgi/Mesvir1/29081/Mv18387-RA.1
MELNTLVRCFMQTMCPEREPRKMAEEYLRNASLKPGYAITILNVVAESNVVAVEVRQAAAVNFKNFVRQNWNPVEGQPISDAEKSQIKSTITGMMLNTPAQIQSQLGEALAIISEHDFPDKWPDLLPDLVSKLSTGDYRVTQGVLQTANTIFKRFRGQIGPSDPLRLQLRYVLDLFVDPFLDLFKKMGQAIQANLSNGEVLSQLFSCVAVSCRVFYSLNAVELPDKFEDHMTEWMSEFHNYLVFENALLDSKDEDKPSVLDETKAAICQNINLYLEKNEEEFQSFLPTFVTDVWNLLMKVTAKPGQDQLAITAMRFLTTVSRSVHHGLFKDPETIKRICESIVIPNLRMRPEEEELFETNHVEYIRRDLEGSDSDTRRRTACELIRGLTEKFEAEVTQLCSGYIGIMLHEYAANPTANWKSKDCAIYLVLALAVRQKTAAHGATGVSQLIDVGDFFNKQIVPDLRSPDANALPVLKAGALKYVTAFRLLLPKDTVLGLMPSILALLTAESNVTHSYAAHTLERLLSLKDKDTRQARYSKADIASFLPQLLTNLFAALELPDSSENEYVMRCIMRVIGFAEGDIKPVAPQAVTKLAAMLREICQNPMQTAFVHYLFESIAALIRHACPGDKAMLDNFQAVLFPVFQQILESDIQEFHPYVFQLLAQVAEQHPPPLPPNFVALLPALVSPMLWERKGNVPALVRLLQAYLRKSSDAIVAGGQLSAILGVFQRLIGSKVHDHEGFYILNALIECLPLASMEPFLPTVWSLLCSRLQTSKTVKFVKCWTIFVALYLCKHGPLAVESSLNKVQPGLFKMLLEAFWVGGVGQITGKMECKLCLVATARLLSEYPLLLSDAGNLALWGKLLDAVISMNEGKVDVATDGSAEDEAMETPGYSAAYMQLFHAARPDEDPVADVPDGARYLATALAKLAATHPGKLTPVVQQSLQPVSKEALAKYCQEAGVTIS